MTHTEKAELAILRAQTPAGLEKSGKTERYQELYAQALSEETAEHAAVADLILQDHDIDTAYHYPYKQVLTELNKAIFTLPHNITLNTLIELLIKAQAWKDFVGELRRTCSKHKRTLDSAYTRVTSDWQARSLAHTEWQAKAQAVARYQQLCAIRDEAANTQRQCDLVFERLESQWQTVSRCGAIMDSMIRIGQTPVVNISN